MEFKDFVKKRVLQKIDESIKTPPKKKLGTKLIVKKVFEMAVTEIGFIIHSKLIIFVDKTALRPIDFLLRRKCKQDALLRKKKKLN